MSGPEAESERAADTVAAIEPEATAEETEVAQPETAENENNDLFEAPEGWDIHAKTPAEFLRDNSPTKRSSTSGVWKDIKRLKSRHPADLNGDKTHICTVRLPDADDGSERYCNCLLKLHKNKPKNTANAPSWLTTKAADHLKAEHPVDSQAGAAGVVRAEKKSNESIDVAFDYGMPDADGTDIDSVSKFKLTKRDRSLSAQACACHPHSCMLRHL